MNTLNIYIRRMVNVLVAINEVTLRQARLVLGWVTVCGQVNHLSLPSLWGR